MQAWLDSQATYQLSLQKAKQAADAAAYASQQVEKLNSALSTAQSSLDAVTAQTADEKNGVLDERALIKELMSNVGKYFSVQFFFHVIEQPHVMLVRHFIRLTLIRTKIRRDVHMISWKYRD